VGIFQTYAKIIIPSYWIAAIAFSVSILPFIRGFGTDHHGEVIQSLIPWENISGAKLEKKSMPVVIKVKKFRYRGENYQGALFCNPSNGAETFLIASQTQDVR
jgi:hypothetical protein